MDRRVFCASMLASGSPAAWSAPSKSQPVRQRKAWLDSFVRTRQRDVQGPLQFQKFADEMYVLLAPIEWHPGPAQPGNLPTVRVPVGFVTDLASIPPIFFSYLRPDGPYGYAAIVHDYLYWEQPYERRIADEILNLGMGDFEVDPIKRAAISLAVEKFGSGAWDENRRLRGEGEQRLLTRFPSDPRVKWRDWKQCPGVFSAVSASSNESPAALRLRRICGS